MKCKARLGAPIVFKIIFVKRWRRCAPPKQGGPSLDIYIYMKQMDNLNLTHGYYLPHHQNRWRWKWTIILCFNIHMYFNNFDLKGKNGLSSIVGLHETKFLNAHWHHHKGFVVVVLFVFNSHYIQCCGPLLLWQVEMCPSPPLSFAIPFISFMMMLVFMFTFMFMVAILCWTYI